MLEWVSSPHFDQMLVDTVTATYPEHERERFLGHFRGSGGSLGQRREDATRLIAESQ